MLLKPYWREVNKSSGISDTGFCYIASEVLYHLMGGKEAGIEIWCGRVTTGVHWWLKKDGKNFDATSNQLPPSFDYSQGRRISFLTTFPSKRAISLSKIIGTPLVYLD